MTEKEDSIMKELEEMHYKAEQVVNICEVGREKKDVGVNEYKVLEEEVGGRKRGEGRHGERQRK